MVAVRKASAYSKRKVTPFTRRSKKKSKNYIKAVPLQKVSKFNMGNTKKYFRGEFKNIIRIKAGQNIQIRDMSLEACRMILNNRLTKMFLENYFLACKPYPHQIIRDNKTFSGGSKGERVQSGMKHSFGTTIGRSAHVKRDQDIFVIAYLNKKDTEKIRELCKMISPKLPCTTKTVYEQVGEQDGSSGQTKNQS